MQLANGITDLLCVGEIKKNQVQMLPLRSSQAVGVREHMYNYKTEKEVAKSKTEL